MAEAAGLMEAPTLISSGDASPVSPAVLARIDALQVRYIRALDLRDMAAWAASFEGGDASYICIARENEEQGLPLAIMLDDNQNRISDRVQYVTKIWAGTFEDYTTRHFVQRTAEARRADGLFEVETNFLVAYTTTRGQSEVLVSGNYKDVVQVGEAGATFRSKRAVLDTAVLPRYLVYPV
ncbi:MAG: aromatic-ring-hydroxylating dioxygenase subunit beta [Rhizomicrobium sp.]